MDATKQGMLKRFMPVSCREYKSFNFLNCKLN